MTTLSPAQLQHLDNTLQEEGGVSIFAAHGLLTALNCYPIMLPIEVWLPLLWGEERTFDNWQAMAALFSTLGEFNQHIRHALQNNQLIPLIDYDLRAAFDVAALSEEQQARCFQWCTGFVEGLACDMAFWTKDSNEEVLASVMAISTLAQLSADLEEEDEDYEDEDLDEILDEDDEYEDGEDEEYEADEEDLFDEEDEEFEEEDDIHFTEEELAETMQNLPFFVTKIYQHQHTFAQSTLDNLTESS